MSARTERLLSQYRTYENLVRDAGEDPKAVEDAMDEVSSNRMRMTRQFRNYLSHVQDPGFLEPTDKMLGFLDDRVREWAMRGDVVRKHLKRPAAAVFEDGETCVAVLERAAKLRTTRVVVLSKSGEYELCDLFAVVKAVAESRTAKMARVARLRERPVFVRPEAGVETVDADRVNICTADGTAAGKLLGVMFS